MHLHYARVHLLRICIIFYDFLFPLFCRNSEGKSALDVASESSGGNSQRGDTSYAVQRSSGDNLEPPAATRQVLTGMALFYYVCKSRKKNTLMLSKITKFVIYAKRVNSDILTLLEDLD